MNGPSPWGKKVHPPPSFPLPIQKNTRSGEHCRIASLCARDDTFVPARSLFPTAKGLHRRPLPRIGETVHPSLFPSPRQREALSRECRWAGTSLFLKRALLLCPPPFPPGKKATREKPSAALPLSHAQKAPGHRRAEGKFLKLLAR
ncbi:hypothetical protein HMPREF0262_02019 [Clostridium sp. ATCC 29733]|nr:hypothetical protein HMPREF0262_02019 [Clostridium sp. ATCC 29733]